MLTPTTILKGEFITVDKPTRTGRIYPRKVFEKALAEYQQRISEKKDIGTIRQSFGLDMVDLSKSSHIVTECHWEGDKVVGTVEVLNTEEGKKLIEMIGWGKHLRIVPRGTGSVSIAGKDLVKVDDFSIISFDIDIIM